MFAALYVASYLPCSFSSPWKKTNQKKTPVSRFILRVVATAGARGNSPRFQLGSDRSARFYPAASPMLGAGQREQGQHLVSKMKPPSGGYLMPSALREEVHFKPALGTFPDRARGGRGRTRDGLQSAQPWVDGVDTLLISGLAHVDGLGAPSLRDRAVPRGGTARRPPGPGRPPRLPRCRRPSGPA